jgi:hypothetical protein
VQASVGRSNKQNASERGLGRVKEVAAWLESQCSRDALSGTVFGGTPSFGAQIWAAADRGDITEQQAPVVVRSLMSAGVDTTVHAIAAVLYAFASHPSQWARLRDDAGLARVAFDEAIRLESPVQTFSEPQPAIWVSATEWCLRARRFSCSWDRPIGTPARGKILIDSIWAEIPRVMSVSAWASTNAWANTWHVWKQKHCSP